MPLFRRLNLGEHASIIIWKIEEKVEQMLPLISLHPTDGEKFTKLSHGAKQCEFLALRLCLREYFGHNPPVHYHLSGKPCLKNGKHISFSHTHGFAGLIIGHNGPVGIDLEVYRESIKRIAPKFLRKEEAAVLLPETEVEQIIHLWGAKEVMVKITGDRRLNFKKHLRVSPFFHQAFQETTGLILKEGLNKNVQLYFKTLDNLHLTYGWEAHHGEVGKFAAQKMS